LWAAAACYAAASCVAIADLASHRNPARGVLLALLFALAFQTASIAIRWQAVGHGPYTTMFEILLSNVWSLSLIFALAYWRVPSMRSGAAIVMPIILMLVAWMLFCNRAPGHVPATYDTNWLWVHMFFGKVFMGGLLVAVGCSGIVLLQNGIDSPLHLTGLPSNALLDATAHRFLALALISETLMLIVGAIWAQDAWGRYWAWDPLETWAFLTWLSLVFALHVRVGFHPSLRLRAVMTLPVFVLAFLTFFGVPFISSAPHQGAV